MNKRERFLAAVNGQSVDRPPVTAWVHFLSDHLDGERVARLHLDFIRAYDWDVVKVMNDYRYPVPPGVRTLDAPESLLGYQPLGLDEPCFAEQLHCLARLRAELGPDIALLETGFDPFQQIMRNVGFDQATNLIGHEREAHQALAAITDTLCRYVRAAKAQGADGFFFSINGAIRDGFPRGATDAVHAQMQRPYDLEILRAAEGMVRVLHVHGTGLDLSRIDGYPYEVLSVSDRLPGNPSLRELRAFTDRCLMGGLDETRLQERSLPLVAAEVDDAIAQAGRERLILSPGCTIPSFSPQRSLSFLREYTRAL
ncbi:MAG: uroporphyrinogen decarboxylase family protein [Burkholderiaceae bacterium]